MEFKKINLEDFVKDKIKSKNIDKLIDKNLDKLIEKMQKEPLETMINDLYITLLNNTHDSFGEMYSGADLTPTEATVIMVCVVNKYTSDIEHIFIESLKESQELIKEERGKYVS